MFAYEVKNGSLARVDRPEPLPDPGEVTIDVHVAGMGFIDALWAAGIMPSAPGFVPGIEAAGTVRALGEGVQGLHTGQRVAAILASGGGFAEVARTPATLVAPVPETVDTELAAVIPINSVTAHMALSGPASIVGGEDVLVHAGVGGLGSQFGQVARLLGATGVDAVVGSREKQAAAARLGYRQVFLRASPETIPPAAYDVVIDPVGGEATRSGFGALRSGGRLVKVGNASGAPDASLSALEHWLENKSTVGFNLGARLAAVPEAGTRSLAWVMDAVERGDLGVDLTRVGAPGEVDDMFADLRRGTTRGKLALRLAGVR